MNHDDARALVQRFIRGEEHAQYAEAVYVAPDLYHAINAPLEWPIQYFEQPGVKLALRMDPDAEPGSIALGPLDYLDE